MMEDLRSIQSEECRRTAKDNNDEWRWYVVAAMSLKGL